MKPLVSISCTTYNQEAYIGEALDSFLAQETEFPYEVLVHDDASTDGTAAVIRRFADSHPDIVKPIYQTKNQYSQGIEVGTLNSSRAAGKYIALCEGDDYWVDARKLQKQVDVLERHPEASLCVHASHRVSQDGRKIGEIRPALSDTLVSTETILKRGGDIFATNSMFFRSHFYTTLPRFYYDSPVGDWPLTLYLATMGDVRYIDEYMSAYRVNAKSSWSVRMKEDDKYRADCISGVSSMLQAFDEYTEGAYAQVIADIVLRNNFFQALAEERYNDLREPRFRRFRDELSARSRFAIFLRQHAPAVSLSLRRARKLLSDHPE